MAYSRVFSWAHVVFRDVIHGVDTVMTPYRKREKKPVQDIIRIRTDQRRTSFTIRVSVADISCRR